MTDRELLELAAKAAGYRLRVNGTYFIEVASYSDLGQTCLKRWNPLTDDGDALRLAVKLNIRFAGEWDGNQTSIALVGVRDFKEPHGNNSYSATRRAIVRAAAEIGKAMSERIA